MGLRSRLPIFVFGTMRDPELLKTVAGYVPAPTPAVLQDFRVARASGQDFPLLVRAKGQSAQGLLLTDVDADQLARLDYYEAPYKYKLSEIEVQVDGHSTAALVYSPETEAWEPAEDWDLAKWQIEHGPLIREAAIEIMEGVGHVAPELVAARWPVIRARAQQRINARASLTPTRLRRPHTRADAELLKRKRAYSHYFALDDLTMAYSRFDGQQIRGVDRAVFVAGDAVTVLPYDPVRDTVMLIEQFRAGTFLRGDPNPWSLEAIAGRQDPGESHEDTARREALEETGLTLGALHAVSRYYVSPGCSTEYLTSFIGFADLPETVAGVGGLAEEAEDIRSFVVPFERLMAAVEDGEVENAPLAVSALWLALHRDRLRSL